MMRLGDVVGEALRNVWYGVTRPLVLAAIWALIVGGIAVLDLHVLVDINSDLVRWRQAGAAVVVIKAPGAIDGAACEALSSATGIPYSGAGRTIPDGLALPALPLGTPTLIEVTPGLARLVTATARGSDADAEAAAVPRDDGGILLSDSLASVVGRGPGTSLATAQGPANVVAVFPTPEDGRDTLFSYAALAQVPASGRFDYCWAEVWPPDATTTHLVLTTIAPTADIGAESISVGQLNSTFGATTDAQDAYGHRPTSSAPLVGCVAGLLIGYVGVRLRRLELASALHARVSRRAQLIQVQLETMLWLAVAVIGTAPAVVAAAVVDNPLGVLPVLAPAGLTILAGLVASMIGVGLGLSVTRERHLFVYFNQR
jgi:hypothetical protein